jgi:predicted phosphate transport protein (TIGR00153 family)
MLRWILPREEDFFGFFERHASLTVEGAKEMRRLIGGGVDVRALASRIKEIEHETDVITHACVEKLHKTFITPLDRDAIYQLITRMDDIMDYIEDAAAALMLYELTEMTEPARALADVLVRSTEQVALAVAGLKDVKRPVTILEACIEVNRLENEGDEILRRALADLFRGAKDPLLVLKWKEIYEALENATDRCEDVANVIEGVVLEHG